MGIKENAALFREVARLSQFDKRVTGRTGAMNVSAGLVYDDPCLNAPTGKIWFREGANDKYDSGRAQYLVWHNGKVTRLRSDAVVEVDYNRAGEREVVGAPAQESVLQYGDATSAIYADADPPPPELNNTTLPVANLEDFKPIWDTVNGGLYIYIAPGRLPDGTYWPGGSIDASAYVTATANRKAWVVGGYDETTGVIVADTSTNYYLSQNPTPESGIAATFAGATFADAFPLFAVAVPEGATTNAGLTLVDIRAPFGRSGAGSGFSADNILLNSYGDILTNGTNVLTNGA